MYPAWSDRLLVVARGFAPATAAATTSKALCYILKDLRLKADGLKRLSARDGRRRRLA